jgi:hypothetical protein
VKPIVQSIMQLALRTFILGKTYSLYVSEVSFTHARTVFQYSVIMAAELHLHVHEIECRGFERNERIHRPTSVIDLGKRSVIEVGEILLSY